MECVASSVTVPVGLTQGAAQVTVRPAVPEIRFTGSLKVAVTVVSIATPAAPLSGVTAVTIGGDAVAPSVPKICVRLPLQPATSAQSSIATVHVDLLQEIFTWLISIPS
jgi:hypothetical protein